MAWSIAETGQLGDTVGGFANVFTMLIAFWATWRVRKELDKFRQQHRLEVTASVARRVWESTFRFASALTHVTGAGRDRLAIKDDRMRHKIARLERYFDAQVEELESASSEYQRAFADAQLHFGVLETEPLEALWRLHEDVLSWKSTMYWLEQGVRNPDAEADAAKLHDAVTEQLERARSLLRPHALLQ